MHGELTDKRLERIADKLRCRTISVHVDEVDLQRISGLSKYGLLIEYPEKNAENKQSLMRLLNRLGDDVGILVDLPEVYRFELIEEASIRQRLSTFWGKIGAFHTSDIVGYLYNMAVGMGLGSVDFTILREFNVPAIIEIHPVYGIFDLVASKYNHERLVNGKGELPRAEVLKKCSKEFNLKTMSSNQNFQV